ncbi:MAG: hypothetical protein ACJ8C4_01250 [Gemmataceae bacterium]
MVRRIRVVFTESVNFSLPVVQAFTLHRNGPHSATAGPDANVGLTASPAIGPTNSVILTFSGPVIDSTFSLIDGVYDFTIDASKISGLAGNLNGSGSGVGTNYTVVGNTANKWYRFFGDGNGDGAVDQTDYLAFRNALSGGPKSVFNIGGGISQSDYLEFRKRLAGAP